MWLLGIVFEYSNDLNNILMIFFRPCVDPMRSPWAGRLWEAFGEDPYLAGVAASETVIGIQSQHVVCSCLCILILVQCLIVLVYRLPL